MQWPAGLRPSTIRKLWFDQLANVPPGLELLEVGSRLGKPYTDVYRWATLFHYPFPDRRKNRSSTVDWSKVNWEQRDATIAGELGLSRERVRPVRKLKGVGLCAAARPLQQFKEFDGNRGEHLWVRTCNAPP